MKVIKKIAQALFLLNSFVPQSNAWFGWGEKPETTERIEENQNIIEITQLIQNSVTAGLGQISQDLKNDYQEVLLKTINHVFDQIQNQSQQICNQTEVRCGIEYFITNEIIKTLNELVTTYKDQISEPTYLSWLTSLAINKLKELHSTQEQQSSTQIIKFEEIKLQISDIVSQNFASLIARTGEIIERDNQEDITTTLVTKEIVRTVSTISNQVGVILAELTKNLTYQFVEKKLYDLSGSYVYRGAVAGFAATKIEATIVGYTQMGINKLNEKQIQEIIMQTINPHLLRIMENIVDKKRKKGYVNGPQKKRKKE